MDEPLNMHAKLALPFGQENKLPNYIQRKIDCSEDDAWVFTAVAVRLVGANRVYRGTSGSTYIYVTFGEITLHRP